MYEIRLRRPRRLRDFYVTQTLRTFRLPMDYTDLTPVVLHTIWYSSLFETLRPFKPFITPQSPSLTVLD